MPHLINRRTFSAMVDTAINKSAVLWVPKERLPDEFRDVVTKCIH